MFCSRCGTAVTDDAKFCHKCGKSVPLAASETDSSPEQLPAQPTPLVATQSKNNGERVISRLLKSIAPNKHQRVIPIILAISLLGNYWMQFDQASILPVSGPGHFDAQKNIGSFLLMGGFISWYIWKCVDRRGWIGALIGVVASLVVFGLCSTIVGRGLS